MCVTLVGTAQGQSHIPGAYLHGPDPNYPLGVENFSLVIYNTQKEAETACSWALPFGGPSCWFCLPRWTRAAPKVQTPVGSVCL